MKNPLRKRLFRELKGEAGKYFVIFFLLMSIIGFVSGFLVADGSMLTAYNESFEKYNIEDGNFTVKEKVNRAQQKEIAKSDVTLYENFYVEPVLTNGSYSLPTYVTLWNGEAFVMTTIVPVFLMAVINFFLLKRTLSLSPLKFLRRDLKKRKQKHTLPLSARLPFFSRFRLRVIFQNVSNYVVLTVGILFANLLLIITLPLEEKMLEVIFTQMMMTSMSGWIPFYVSPTLFPEMFAIGILTYAVVAVIEYRKVRKIPMEEALKNVE